MRFDLEDLNVLRLYQRSAEEDRQGFTEILVTEAAHPYLKAWWPAGHVLGYEHGFVHQAHDFIVDIAARRDPAPSFADGLAVQRVLSAVERSTHEDSRWVPVH